MAMYKHSPLQTLGDTAVYRSHAYQGIKCDYLSKYIDIYNRHLANLKPQVPRSETLAHGPTMMTR